MNKTIQFDQGREHQKEIDLAHLRLSNAEIEFIAGIMTPAELRCVQAVLSGIRSKIKFSFGDKK